MKILYVVHQFFPECYSGTEQYCLAVAREARRREHDVTILSLWPDAGREDPPLLVVDQPYDGFPVLRLRHWWGLLPNEVLRDYHNPIVAACFGKVLDELRPEVVHFFHLRNLGSDLLAEAAGRGARTVVHLMDFWYLCPRFTLQRSDGALCEGPLDGGLGCVSCHVPELEEELGVEERQAVADLVRSGGAPGVRYTATDRLAALLRRREVQLRRLAAVDAIVAPSHFLHAMFRENGFASDRVHVIGYGLEPGRVDRRAVERPRRPLRLTFAGVLSPWKGPQVAIEAVLRSSADVSLRVYGNLDEEMFAEHIASLRGLAAGEGRIDLRGPFDAEAISDVLEDTDVLLVPSMWYENTPFVMLEALAAGVPVAASALGGMAELVEEGRNGFLFPAGDSDALAALITRWSDHPEELRRLDPRPVGTIGEAFDRFEELYRS